MLVGCVEELRQRRACVTREKKSERREKTEVGCRVGWLCCGVKTGGEKNERERERKGRKKERKKREGEREEGGGQNRRREREQKVKERERKRI